MDKWIKKDLKYNWHPYTQMKDCRDFPPILIEKARGMKLYDKNGNFYYDTISSWWCNIHGHDHPVIKDAIKNTLKKLDHVLFAGFTHENAVLLGEKLVSLMPRNITKVFFSDNGSTAVETALKMSFQYRRNKGHNKRTKFISLDKGYHGDTVGAMSVSGVNLFNETFKPLFFKSLKAPSPYCYRCPMGKAKDSCDIECADAMEGILKKEKDNVTAIILEPILMAAGGMIIYPSRYLKKVEMLSKKYKAHLILDEVASGFGRTGKMFALERANIEPDFICLSKGLTNGCLPLAATLTTDKIYKAFYADHDKKRTFYHGHTYTANPIACGAALGSLEVFKKERTLRNVRKLTAVFKKELEKFNELTLVGDVRHIGLVGALELVGDRKTKEPFGLKERIGFQIYKEGLKKHLVLRPLGNIVYLFLPLSVKKEELIYICRETYRIIKKISEKKT